MTLIDPETNLFALVAEDFRAHAERSERFDDFVRAVGWCGHSFFGGFVHTRSGDVVVQDDEGAVLAVYPLREVYDHLVQPRLPLF